MTDPAFRDFNDYDAREAAADAWERRVLAAAVAVEDSAVAAINAAWPLVCALRTADDKNETYIKLQQLLAPFIDS